MSIKSALKAIQKGQDQISNARSKIDSNISATINNIGAGIAVGAGGLAAVNGINQSLSDTANSYMNILPSNSAGGIGGNIVDNILPAVAPSAASLVNSISGGTSLTYPTTLKNIALNPAHINFQFFDRDTKLKTTSINLPMPDNVSNPSTIEWDQENFGMIGDALVKGLKHMGSGAETNVEDVKEKISAMGERIKSLAFYTGMSNLVGGLGGNASAEGIMGAVSGKVPNPYRTLLFRGVDFRSFTFEFRFVPFSESDCTLIDNIITKFREHSYPDFAADKMFFTYPDECQITYMWESSHNKWLNNFKRAVCTGIDVNFAPLGQWSSMRNGFPNMIILSTRWKEVEIITKGDIKYKDSKGQRS